MTPTSFSRLRPSLNPFRDEGRRVLSLALVPMLIVALLLSVIVPALEMRRVMRLLSEIGEIVGPVTEVSYRLEQVAGHESQSLFVNAVLVIVALAAIAAVVSVSVRERRLAEILRRRVEEESAMARMARMLSEAATLEEAIDRILAGTTASMHAVGAYVEIIDSDGEPRRSAALIDGRPVRHLGVLERLPIPLMDEMKLKNASGLPYEIDGMEWRLPLELIPDCVHCAGLAVPLVVSDEPFGMLVLLRDARTGAFVESERCQLRLIGDLATSVIRRLQMERKARLEIEQRVTSETTLREAAEALAGAFSMEDVTREIAHSALDSTQGKGAFVESIDSAPDGTVVLVVRGSAGTGIPLIGTTRAYSGSFIEQTIEKQETAVATSSSVAYPPTSAVTESDSSSAIVMPIRDSMGPVGALSIVGTDSSQLRPEDTSWAHTLAHLATLAYEKVRLLNEARDGRDELERVMKSRQRLMRGFSHDVKNPLGAANGYADLLSAGIYGELAPEQTESLQRIRRSIRRALDLIDDLHELARAETGSIALRSELVDIGELVKTTGDEYRGAAHATGLPLTVDVEDDIPMVETDSARLRQIIGNLISNAIKYTKTGAVNLRVRNYSSPGIRTVPWVDIEVTDSGIGIPPEKHEQIFEEFSRLGTSDRPGAGLGLAISKRVAEALGGQILVNSEVGSGSTFTLRIPVITQARASGTSVARPGTIGSLSPVLS